MRDEHLCCIIGYNVVPLQDGVIDHMYAQD